MDEGPIEPKFSEVKASKVKTGSKIQTASKTSSKTQVTSKDNESPTAVTLEESSGQAGYELVGSKTSDKYHKLSCLSAAKIKQKIYFKSAEDAKKKVYKP